MLQWDGWRSSIFISKKCVEGNSTADTDLINSVCSNVREKESFWEEEVEISKSS